MKKHPSVAVGADRSAGNALQFRSHSQPYAERVGANKHDRDGHSIAFPADKQRTLAIHLRLRPVRLFTQVEQTLALRCIASP